MRATPTITPRYALMKNNYRRRLELHTLEVLQTPSVGEVCEYPEVSSFLNSYLVLELVYVLAPCSIKEKKWKKTRGVAIVTILSPSTRCRGKYPQCPTFDIKQSPARRSPEHHQVRAQAYLCLNKAQSYFMFPLSILVCSGLNVWRSDYIHRRFKLSMVLWLKCLLRSNWHGVKFDWCSRVNTCIDIGCIYD